MSRPIVHHRDCIVTRSILSACLGLFVGMGSRQEGAGNETQERPLQPPPPETEPSEHSRTSGSGAPVIEITPELNEAVRRGLAYLAAQQNKDGSFGTHPRYGRNVAVTGLCALAFMADGHLPGRGEYGDVVAGALDFVLDNTNDNGVIAAATSHGPMYGHGFATLFLGEIYGMGGTTDEDPRIREALVKAVQLIVKTQNEEGGWRYNPVPEDADVSVTICQVMALRSARNAGIKVPKETIDRAVEYVRNCQNLDGGFRYMTSAGTSAWPRSAAGVATLYYAGIYEDDSITRGLDYLIRSAFPGTRRQQAHYFYGNYYAAQAMFLAGGDYWDKWWPSTRDELIARQDPNTGAWVDQHSAGPYGTAMACIVLQMPKRYLPIFQK